MSVRQSLLAILDQGDCYGYQLRGEFERRTGRVASLNVGQTYATLDRLERDGLVERGAVDDDGHVFYRITEAGRTEAAGWFATPRTPSTASRDELAAKIALAATLPGIDASAVIAVQRAAILDQLDHVDAVLAEDDDAALRGEAVARRIVASAEQAKAAAELGWLDQIEQMLLSTGADGASFGLGSEKPRRGRPANRATASEAPASGA